MAGPRLEELRERLRDRMASHVTDTFLTDERVDRAINHGIRQVTSEHDWYWLDAEATISTEVDKTDYPVPADFIRTDSIYDTEFGTLLVARSVRDLMPIIQQGRPTIYAVRGGNIKIRAVPDKVYTLTHLYVRNETPLLGDADRPLIPDPFCDGPIEYAAYLLFRATRESDKAAEAAAAYNGWLKRTQDNTKQTKAPIRVTVRPGAEF